MQHIRLPCSLLSPRVLLRLISSELTLSIRWPKYRSFSFSISPSNEYSGLISFRMDWLDLLIVQGTLKSLLQHHSSRASILHCPDFFKVQLSHLYMTTRKTIVCLCFLICCLGYNQTKVPPPNTITYESGGKTNILPIVLFKKIGWETGLFWVPILAA